MHPIFVNSAHEFDNGIGIIIYWNPLSRKVLEYAQNSIGNGNNNDKNKYEDMLKTDITNEQWQAKLIEKYELLRHKVEENLPNLWDSLDFEISVLRILNIKNCTLPFAGILLGRPMLNEVGIELFRKWHNIFYTDNCMHDDYKV